MKRREFLGLVGGVAADCPATERAQQAMVPAVRYLDARPAESVVDRLRGFRLGGRRAVMSMAKTWLSYMTVPRINLIA